MAKLVRWNAQGVMDEIFQGADANAVSFMERVASLARQKVPIGTIIRKGKWSGEGTVRFIPRTGKNRGQVVTFTYQRRWLGREPGDLRDTIRVIYRPDKGNVRVYAGNYKIFWAFMVERGTAKTKKQPFLRPAFLALKKDLIKAIETGKV